MDNKINVINENNEIEEVEIIDFFQLEEYDHEYALYTKNEEVGDNVVTYVSIINQVGNNEYQFEAITDLEEQKKVEEKIEEEIELLLKQ